MEGQRPYQSWWKKRKSWLVGAAAGIAGMIGVDRVIHPAATDNEAQKPTPEFVKKKDGDKTTFDDHAEVIRAVEAERAEEKRQEEITKVRSAIDAMFNPEDKNVQAQQAWLRFIEEGYGAAHQKYPEFDKIFEKSEFDVAELRLVRDKTNLGAYKKVDSEGEPDRICDIEVVDNGDGLVLYKLGVVGENDGPLTVDLENLETAIHDKYILKKQAEEELSDDGAEEGIRAVEDK